MKKLLILFVLVGFFVGCARTYIPKYNPSPEQLEKNRKSYEQRQRDKVQRDILKELKKQNRRK